MADNTQNPKQPLLLEEFEGVVLTKSPSGDLTIDLSALIDVNIKIISYRDSKIANQTSVEEQTNNPDVTQSSVDKRAVQIGDVLGVDVDLPEDLERLNGWLVYNITDEGVPQVLEPTKSAVEGVVTWYEANEHVKAILKGQGHENARLWAETDGQTIFNNVVKGGHNDKAQLDVRGYNSRGRYWEYSVHPHLGIVRYAGNSARIWSLGPVRTVKTKMDLARVRAVQDVPELKISCG